MCIRDRKTALKSEAPKIHKSIDLTVILTMIDMINNDLPIRNTCNMKTDDDDINKCMQPDEMDNRTNKKIVYDAESININDIPLNNSNACTIPSNRIMNEHLKEIPQSVVPELRTTDHTGVAINLKSGSRKIQPIIEENVIEEKISIFEYLFEKQSIQDSVHGRYVII